MWLVSHLYIESLTHILKEKSKITVPLFYLKKTTLVIIGMLFAAYSKRSKDRLFFTKIKYTGNYIKHSSLLILNFLTLSYTQTLEKFCYHVIPALHEYSKANFPTIQHLSYQNEFSIVCTFIHLIHNYLQNFLSKCLNNAWQIF